MTTPQVWVSTTSPQIDYDGLTSGNHWELVGTINTSQESDFHTHIQVLLGRRRTTRGRPEFYLDGNPDSGWVQVADRKPFWVAIDPRGEMRPHINGARPTFFVSSGKAVVTKLTRRAPEPHPGLTVKLIRSSDSVEANQRRGLQKVGAGGRLTRDRDDTDGSPWFRASREAVDVLDVIAVQSAFTSIACTT